MARLFLLFEDVLPKTYHSTFRGFSVRDLAPSERISIEDFFFNNGEKISLHARLSVVEFPSTARDVTANNHLIMIGEFALALLAIEGHPKVIYAATFDRESCLECVKLATALLQLTAPRFVPRLSGDGAAQWVYQCANVQARHFERLMITATRFVRFSRFQESSDAVLDLCISLESLLDTQTEIAFRFALTFVKLLKQRGPAAQKTATLLSDLYLLRCKLAHGDPAADKLLKKVLQSLGSIRTVSRSILVMYVLYCGDHSRNDWKTHLRNSIYA